MGETFYDSDLPIILLVLPWEKRCYMVENLLRKANTKKITAGYLPNNKSVYVYLCTHVPFSNQQVFQCTINEWTLEQPKTPQGNEVGIWCTSIQNKQQFLVKCEMTTWRKALVQKNSNIILKTSALPKLKFYPQDRKDLGNIKFCRVLVF